MSTGGSAGTASASTSVAPARVGSVRRVSSKGGRSQHTDVRRAKSRGSKRTSRASNSVAVEEDMNDEAAINETLQNLQNEFNSTLNAIQKEHNDCLTFTLSSISQYFSVGTDGTNKDLEDLSGKFAHILAFK